MKIAASFFTNKGGRKNNEDSILINEVLVCDSMDKKESIIVEKEHIMFAVADGMGGQNSGEIASRLTLEAFIEKSNKIIDGDTLIEIIINGSDKMKSMEEDRLETNGMGTTITAIILSDKSLVINIGDSRVYRKREERLDRLTKDHSIVQKMCDAGIIDEDDMRIHPRRNIITSAIMANIDITTTEIQISRISIEKEDIYMLCSDGIWESLTKNELTECFKSENIEEICDCIVEKAMFNRAGDNISIIIIKILEVKNEQP